VIRNEKQPASFALAGLNYGLFLSISLHAASTGKFGHPWLRATWPFWPQVGGLDRVQPLLWVALTVIVMGVRLIGETYQSHIVLNDRTVIQSHHISPVPGTGTG